MFQHTFPTLYAIALDFLPIQASSVPSERVFSSSAETDTLRRNRIKPILMEALQMLKFGFFFLLFFSVILIALLIIINLRPQEVLYVLH
jgi:hypothetical protein